MSRVKSRALKFRFVIGLITLLSVTVLSGCEETGVKQQPDSYRFEKVEQVSFEDPHGQIRGHSCNEYATVYRDNETGIEYLLYSSGTTHEGPAITRLWEAEDKE